MIEDAELLRRYAADNAEEAFAELVQRHVNFVYGCALRRTSGDAHFAEDVTQQVFAALAQKAPALTRHPVLSGWLFQATRLAAGNLMRTERRRQAHEREAQLMNEITSQVTNDAEWKRLRPVLDAAMDRLNEADRQAVLLRFFEGKSFSEIGTRLQLAENTARMRVDRAVDRLKAVLARQGVTSTTAGLGLALANQAVVAAPAGLAAAVTGAAMSGVGAAAGAAAGGGLIAAFMTMTKLQVGIASALAVAGATGFALQTNTNAALRTEIASLRQANAALAPLQTEHLKLTRAAAEVAELRNDDAALKRLSEESVVLQKRVEEMALAKAAAAASAQAYDVSKLDQTPQPRLQPRPQYPLELRTAGVQGEVVVDFVIDPNGEVRNAYAKASSLKGERVTTSGEQPGAGAKDETVVLSPFAVAATGTATMSGVAVADAKRLLEASAVEAVGKWKFSPGRRSGRDVPTHMQLPIVFTLNEE